MESYHDPIRQLKYLRQTLSQNKRPLGFFLSAGCPLAVKMPDGEWPLIPDIAGLTEFVSAALKSTNGTKNDYDLLIDELIKSGVKNPNIEEILSFVRGLKHISIGAENVRGFKEDGLEILEKNISKKIVDKSNVELPNTESPYHQLAQLVFCV